jgi:hypothetical protein
MEGARALPGTRCRGRASAQAKPELCHARANSRLGSDLHYGQVSQLASWKEWGTRAGGGSWERAWRERQPVGWEGHSLQPCRPSLAH